ncbi:MAG: hypothetical protein QF733_07735 [Phycisphaerales bacterium]|jgi:hypothetical protein|nr:hypothetical protein [Phycisphaerales bacterium]
MILSTAYALILGLSYQPCPVASLPASPPTGGVTAVRPAQPVSLAAGDSLGMALMASSTQDVPPLLASRLAAVASAPPSWTLMSEDGTRYALGH